VRDVVETMGCINAQAQRIRDIIGVSDGIAFQTNILSLNAAVVVNAAVSDMDRSTLQNAAPVEQAAAATESYKTQTGGLLHALAAFRSA
jgi:methyl-accepting chemotaxis protein